MSRDFSTKWPEAQPRWGTFFVRAHLDTRRLITDLLLYDVLVFPSPSDEAEAERWDSEGWDVGTLTRRAIQLGCHAVVRPWDSNLRLVWETRYRAALAAGPVTDAALAFDTTTAVLAGRSYLDLLEGGDEAQPSWRAEDSRREPPLILPEVLPALSARDARIVLKQECAQVKLVAAFQDTRLPRILTETSLMPGEERPGNPALDIGLRFRLEVDVPDGGDEEETSLRAVSLVANADFREARHRLWSWEEAISPGTSLQEVAARVDGLIADYNDVVRSEVRASRREAVFLLAPAAVGVVADLAIGGIGSAAIGIGTSVLVDRAKLKFPGSKPAESAAHHPASALAKAMAVVAHN